MPKFQLYYGLGGGFNSVQKQEIEEFPSQESADDSAFEGACEEYDGMAGLHGLRDTTMIMDEDGVDEDEAQGIYEEEREGWIEYYARELREDGSEVG
jgi:hypothetical protein